ncbi:hypothetical protein [Nocardia jiangxiensis]|uniref:hypothetical protein n=1 Tax=Nocardia jiangxiensis TaxID=282685 RepID=UPI0002EB4FE1|nr:hypothetical protein [Nocardia jiangxiensis]
MIRSAIAAGALACAALGLSVGTAGADTAPGPYIVNGTAYFNVGGRNCSITANGVAGCDVSPTAVMMDMMVGGIQVPTPYVPSVVVGDMPNMPGHPGWFSGSHAGPNGNPALPNLTGGPYGSPQQAITYAGATCRLEYRGAVDCQSGGHQFIFNSGQISGT